MKYAIIILGLLCSSCSKYTILSSKIYRVRSTCFQEDYLYNEETKEVFRHQVEIPCP